VIKQAVQPISVPAREAAKMLGISVSSLTTLTNAGELKHWRLHAGGPRQYAVKDLEGFVERRIAEANGVLEPIHRTK
jgi:DNA-binding transcriptional MerR regulator